MVFERARAQSAVRRQTDMRFRLNTFLFIVNVAVLAAGTYFFFTHKPSPVVVAEDTAQAEAAVPEMPTEPEIAVVTNQVVVTNRLEWSQLESEDYRDYILRLREIGCPAQTIRDIIIADLDKLFAPRAQAIKGRRADLKYWHPEEEELANNLDQREVAKQERAIEKEKRAALQELLGVDLVRERLKQQGQDDYYERRLGFLPEEKRGAVRQLLEDFDEREQAILRKEDDGELLSAADKAELHKLRQEREAEVARALTPEEAQQYQLWLSPTANAVRQSIYGMNASEEEFLTIYNLRQSFAQAWGGIDPNLLGEERRALYEQAQAQLEAQLRSQLGERRYADLKRGQDPDFHHLNAVVSRHKLPRQKAAEVYELKRAIQAMREAVLRDARLAAEQKERAIVEMNAETRRIAQGLLGDKAFSSYLRRGQGEWLQN
jgi:hypothetical protein